MPDTGQLIRVPSDLHAELKTFAKSHKLSLADVTESLLREIWEVHQHRIKGKQFAETKAMSISHLRDPNAPPKVVKLNRVPNPEELEISEY